MQGGYRPRQCGGLSFWVEFADFTDSPDFMDSVDFTDFYSDTVDLPF